MAHGDVWVHAGGAAHSRQDQHVLHNATLKLRDNSYVVLVLVAQCNHAALSGHDVLVALTTQAAVVPWIALCSASQLSFATVVRANLRTAW